MPPKGNFRCFLASRELIVVERSLLVESRSLLLLIDLIVVVLLCCWTVEMTSGVGPWGRPRVIG